MAPNMLYIGHRHPLGAFHNNMASTQQAAWGGAASFKQTSEDQILQIDEMMHPHSRSITDTSHLNLNALLLLSQRAAMTVDSPVFAT